ncbi:MAG TPA: PDZ domain-containing protein [Thermoanaerobaculia bacterium]|nr:PDZ domain-containing protein [Thermoanaerobaculia bacterium]
MTRRRIILFFAVAMACAFVAGAAGQCPQGHPETGDIGISNLLCVGGSCSVNLRTGRGYAHDFSTEPRIQGLEKDGPAWAKLQDGDILVAIDGILITTREGGRRLANLTPGKPVTLRIRREGKEMDVIVIPRTGCNMPMLAVLGGGPATAPAIQKIPLGPPSSRLLPAGTAPVDFGMEIDCGGCGWRREAGKLVFYTRSSPLVLTVVPGGPADRAGIRPDDVILKVNGIPLSSPDGGEHLGEIRPGQAITLEIGRGGSLRSVKIVPRVAAPGQRF